jgi:hypothetical protein
MVTRHDQEIDLKARRLRLAKYIYFATNSTASHLYLLKSTMITRLESALRIWPRHLTNLANPSATHLQEASKRNVVTPPPHIRPCSGKTT